ncbi:VanZ family protein [Clostridium estertheticum]|uniref:VanZ family protein n=1 Tax=Clostridium estertheticum TaxID=238834 RepID=UPI001CF5B560|nr:VanZ family protein [Clostridium estertheticum]MCB2309411.1 VanZ family protein [Clostridium estertheticum]MCB2347851.1 VanZ family protein [Clostridium estertheticum]MCB2352371.1 VanZ family protein [Clostridium estertheticum]WAG46940.1 VanZ family protein [Clostridium estertheticum]
MRKKHLNWILVIGWMIIIFIFSSQVGEVSNENNKFVIYVFNLLGLNLNNIFGTLSNFIVRKASHFTEYFILYMLIYRAMNKSKKIDMKIFIASILIVFLYACSDEFHQSFVPGRGPALRDVMVDTCGGLTAFLFIYIRVTLKKRPDSNKIITKLK